MAKITLLLSGFGLFIGIVLYFVFKNQKLHKFQLVAIIVMVLFPLLLNIVNFYVFDEIIKPLIPCEKYDGNYGWYAGIQVGGLISSICAIGIVLGSSIGIVKTKKYSNFLDAKPLPKTAATNADGRDSIIRCPRCKTTLPFHWLFLSGNKSDYSCTKCNAVLEWTRRRMIIGAIVGGLSAPITMSSKLILDTFWPGIIIAIGLAVLFVLAVPGKYRIKEQNEDS